MKIPTQIATLSTFSLDASSPERSRHLALLSVFCRGRGAPVRRALKAGAAPQRIVRFVFVLLLFFQVFRVGLAVFFYSGFNKRGN